MFPDLRPGMRFRAFKPGLLIKTDPQDMNFRFFSGEVDRFLSGFHKVMIKIAIPKTDSAKQKFADNLHAKLVGLEPPTRKKKLRSRRNKAIVDIFQTFVEVSNSYERLLDFEIYIRRYPFKGTRITKQRYLEFIVHAHLNEVYLFQNRLKKFFKTIFRRLKGNVLLNRKQREKILIDAIKKSLKNLVEVRGAHVHEQEFSDKDLERLELFDFVRIQMDMLNEDIFKNLVDFDYRIVRKRFDEVIKKNNVSLKELLDVFMKNVNSFLLTPRGRFRVELLAKR